MSKTITFGNRTIGDGHPLYYIADIGANHEDDLDRARMLIELAKESGADAAKFQNFQAAKIVSDYGFKSLGKTAHTSGWKKSVFEVFDDASINKDWTAALKEKCDEVGIDYFTSPYDTESVDLVEPYLDVYKIGSGDITWHDMIRYIANKGKPVMIATGASPMNEVEMAMQVLQEITSDVVLMQCNTNYTTNPEKMRHVNLNVLKAYAEKFPDTILGLSDHTAGHASVVAAVALGARVFEKHFTDDNDRIGPDHPFAMNPKSWRAMVDTANEAYAALGDGIKRIEDNEIGAILVQRRSLRATADLPIGKVIERADLEALRPIPEDGLPPYKIDELVGKTLTKALVYGEHITMNHIG